MVMRAQVRGVVTLVLVALSLVACARSKRAGGGTHHGSGGSGASSGAAGSGSSGGSSGSAGSGGSSGSSGSTGGASGGSSGAGGATGGGGATASGGAGAGTAGTTDAGDAGEGGAGGVEERATFHWIEAAAEHRERAASSSKPAFLRTIMLAPWDAPVLVGTSELTIGEGTDELWAEGIVWTEETGTLTIGALPGVVPISFGIHTVPSASSADGSVVVGGAVSSARVTVPFRWTRASGIEALGDDGYASKVSADGSVVVGGYSQRPSAVFRWTRELGAVTIVEPLAGDDTVSPSAMSPDGAAVLGSSYRIDDSAGSLFVWTEDSGVRAIANLPGYRQCRSDQSRFSPSSGFVAAGVCFNERASEMFVWAGQDGLVGLGPTDEIDGQLSYPFALTDDGSVAVGLAYQSERDRVYRWTEANGFELVALPEGYTSSGIMENVRTMTDDGSVVVGTMSGTAGSHAFRWTESAGAVVLSPLEGDENSSATLVSADGSVTAGTSSSGETRSAVYWRADGVPHRITDELDGVELGSGTLSSVRSVQSPLGFFGYGSKDAVSTFLAWRALLP